MEENIKLPDPIALYDCLWYENGMCCLFASTGVGKTILAVQIAEEIARKGKNVLYFDFELSAKQFQMRYTSDDRTVMHHFPPNLFRTEIDEEAVNVDAVILKEIKDAAAELDCKVIIIDNISWLEADTQKGVNAVLLMRELKQLKKQGWSILIVAHTPKRDTARPLTTNDLSGSANVANFFDSIVAIGRSVSNPRIRYLKQVKERNVEPRYTETVPYYTLEKTDNALRFVYKGFATERELLKPPPDEEAEAERENVRRLSAKGKSAREIAAELGISKSKAARIITSG